MCVNIRGWCLCWSCLRTLRQSQSNHYTQEHWGSAFGIYGDGYRFQLHSTSSYLYRKRATSAVVALLWAALLLCMGRQKITCAANPFTWLLTQYLLGRRTSSHVRKCVSHALCWSGGISFVISVINENTGFKFRAAIRNTYAFEMYAVWRGKCYESPTTTIVHGEASISPANCGCTIFSPFASASDKIILQFVMHIRRQYVGNCIR